MLKWKHYSEILGEGATLFVGGASPTDVRQGALGDCYLLSAIASLAEYANLIERLFDSVDLESGYFLVWICCSGEWKLVELDGYFPVTADGKAIAFTTSKDKELWVSLLEKAYAKVYGSYGAIVGGDPMDAITDLTGSPGVRLYHRGPNPHLHIKPPMLWGKLMEANRLQHIITAGTAASEEVPQGANWTRPEEVTKMGIVLGHAYSVLDVAEYKGEKLIKLRNPWGSVEWKGDWSDSSPKWTPDAKKTLGFTNEDDGIFWMPFSSYFESYLQTNINYLEPTFNYNELAQVSKEGCHVYRLKTTSTDAYLALTHRDSRVNQGSDQPYSEIQLYAV